MANITIRDAGPDENSRFVRKDLNFYYNGNGTLWVAIWDQWQVDENGYVADSYATTSAREFRFDSPRERYLVRDVNPNDGSNFLMPLNDPARTLWTDYHGVAPQVDYAAWLDENEAVQSSGMMSYTSGLGIESQTTLEGASPPGVTRFLRPDLIGSTVLTTGDGELVVILVKDRSGEETYDQFAVTVVAK